MSPIKTVRERLIPNGIVATLKIDEAEEVSGQFGPQLELKLKIENGDFAGTRFKDWCQLTEDSGEVIVKENSKGGEVVLAALGEDGFENLEDFSELEGKRIVSRITEAGKSKRRNSLEFGTIGPVPKKSTKRSKKAQDEEVLDEVERDLSEAEESAMHKALG